MVSTYRVALYLLDRAHFAEHVPLSTAALKKRGVSRARNGARWSNLVAPGWWRWRDTKVGCLSLKSDGGPKQRASGLRQVGALGLRHPVCVY